MSRSSAKSRAFLAIALCAATVASAPSAVLAQQPKAKETPSKPEPSKDTAKESAYKELKQAFKNLHSGPAVDPKTVDAAREEMELRVEDYLKRYNKAVRDAKEARDSAAAREQELFHKAMVEDKVGALDKDPDYQDARKKYDENAKKYDEALRVEKQNLYHQMARDLFYFHYEIGAAPRPPSDQGSAFGGAGMEAVAYVGAVLGVTAPEWAVDGRPSFGFGFDALPLAQHWRHTFDNTAFVGGGQVGVDVRLPSSFLTSYAEVPPIFAGVVFDFVGNATGQQRRDAIFFGPFGGAFPTLQAVGTNYVSTERVVVGFEQILSDGLPFALIAKPYGTAGFAFGEASVADGILFGGAAFNYAAWSGTRTGWAAGGGVRVGVGALEYQVQYLRVDLGTVSTVAPNSANSLLPIEAKHQIAENRITFGVNVTLRALGL